MKWEIPLKTILLRDNMIRLDLFCDDERRFTPHSITEGDGDNEQTIECLTCGRTRVDVMFRKVGINMSIKKEVWEVFKQDGGRTDK